MMSNTAPAPEEKIRSGYVWYAAILPALGLFLENYTLNKYLGMFLWGVIVIARPLSCLLDHRRLTEQMGAEPSPRWLALLPTVYIFKRCTLLRQNTAIGVVCLICFSYGVIGNGFVVGLRVDDDAVIETTKNTSPYSLDEFADYYNGNDFSDDLENTLKDISYSLTRSGDTRTVTVSGTDRATGELIELVFTVTHDGYTYTDYELSEIRSGGKKVEGEDKDNLIDRLLGTGTSDEPSGEQS